MRRAVVNSNSQLNTAHVCMYVSYRRQAHAAGPPIPRGHTYKRPGGSRRITQECDRGRHLAVPRVKKSSPPEVTLAQGDRDCRLSAALDDVLDDTEELPRGICTTGGALSILLPPG